MSLILTHEQIVRKIKRMAYQVYEMHVESKGLIIAGIADNGYVLATKIAEELKSISTLEIELAKITVVKANPSEATTQIETDLSKAKGNHVLVVDDVLNTGKTMAYGLFPFFRAGAATIKTAVLADRNHKRYPVLADFTGITLATTLHEHIAFEIGEGGEMQLYLS